jgi:hypothetical protein
MPSAMLATAVADPAYQDTLKECGFNRWQTLEFEGKTYTHDDIAAMVDESYQRHRAEFAIQVGGKPRVQRRMKKQFRKAVMGDVGASFQISWPTILLAVLLFVFTGPFGLAMGIASALFTHYLERDLNEDPAMMTAMGCA